jgi:hypothetical protein
MSPGPSQPPSGPIPRSPALMIALAMLAGLTVFRLWYSTRLELVADEAFYWVWSRHLAASYMDKGPAIAWVIAAGTRLFGNTPFGIRFFGVLLSAGTGWQIFRLARRLYGDRAALWCLVIACVIPLYAVGAVIMTIDSISVFSWAWAVNVFWTALDTGRVRHWFGLGLIIGVGFLAKFTNGVQLLCIGLFLLWSPPHRRYLFSRQLLATLIAFGLCTLPVLWWNYQVGWLQLAALHSRSGVEGSFQIRPDQLLRFFGEQLAVLCPLIGLGVAVAAIGLWRSSRREARVKLLLSQFLPLYAIFTLFSLNYAGKGNWPAPAIITGIVMLVVFWEDVVRRRPGWRWAPYATIGLATLMTAGLHLAPFVSWRVVTPLVRRAQGWPDYAAHIERARLRCNASLLIGDHYSQASLAEFYLPGQPHVYLPNGRHPQYHLWGDYRVDPGTRALYITSDTRFSTNLLRAPLDSEFSSRELVDDFWTRRDSEDLSRFRIYLLVAGPSPGALHSSGSPAPPAPAGSAAAN